MMETNWAKGAYRVTGVAEMDEVMGGIFSGDPGVDSLHRSCISTCIISSHLILLYNELHTLSFSSFDLTRSSTRFRRFSRPGSIISSHLLPMLLEPEPLFLTNSFWNAARGAVECQ
jgi:hypothetical protein